MSILYFDHMASTPVAPEVIAAMNDVIDVPWTPFAKRQHPCSSLDAFNRLIDQSCHAIADLIYAHCSEIIITSGATEATNLAIKGLVDRFYCQKHHIITVASEHHATLSTINHIEKQGHEVSILPVNSDGHVDMNRISNAIKPNTLLISICHGNNENGTIIDLDALCQLKKGHDVYLHVDAAQTYGKIPIDVRLLKGIDYMSISAHKIYGPKGIGALYINPSAPKPRAQIHGGMQQGQMRSGTLAGHLIVGFGRAAELAKLNMAEDARHTAAMLALLKSPLQSLFRLKFNGCSQQRLPHHLSIYHPAIDAKKILDLCPDLICSQRSSCQMGHDVPSHVLQAMGMDIHRSKNSLRLSTGRYTTVKQATDAGQLLYRAIKSLI